MKPVQVMPGTPWHATGLMKGYGDIPDLPITLYMQDSAPAVASSYRLSFLQRLRFLFNGWIHVSVFGSVHPPMAVIIGDQFKKKDLLA